MKDFDVVKFTMWLGVVLLVAVLAGKFWVSGKLEEEQVRLRTMRTQLQEIGRLEGQIEFLETELAEDKLLQWEDRPAGFFQFCASQARVDANKDYKLVPKDPDEHPSGGYVDTRFELALRKDREMTRQKIAQLCYAIETSSPRVKLVSAKLTLDHRKAEQDLWNATLQFVRRDPMAR